MGKEDAISLRDECSATRGLVAGDPTTGGDARSPSQLSRFLREPLIAGLHDQVGTEHLLLLLLTITLRSQFNQSYYDFIIMRL